MRKLAKVTVTPKNSDEIVRLYLREPPGRRAPTCWLQSLSVPDNSARHWQSCRSTINVMSVNEWDQVMLVKREQKVRLSVRAQRGLFDEALHRVDYGCPFDSGCPGDYGQDSWAGIESFRPKSTYESSVLLSPLRNYGLRLPNPFGHAR